MSPHLPPATPHAALNAANRRSIASMTIAMAFFIANDAIVKYLSQSLGAAQLIFLRGLFASVLLLAVAWAGIALLVGAGLVMLQTEHARSRAALEAAAD